MNHSPEGAQYASTGCSPRDEILRYTIALKGRPTLAQGETP